MADDEPLELEVRPVTPERWPDLEKLFARKGGPSYCWCMAWRADGDERERTDRRSRKAQMKLRVVEREEPVGLLAYADGKPVGWCSVSPRSTYRRLGGVEYDRVDESKVWSIVCFSIHPSVRRRGVATTLIAEAVDHARRHGARVVEAYPVDPDSPSYRHMGFRSTFEAAGFEHQGDVGTRRHVMARRVRAKRS